MRRSAIALAVIAAAGPALAADSSADLSTGGLIFVRNDNVEMVSEELAISAKEIGVRYRFFNKSEKDVTVLVAFPLPASIVEAPDETVSLPTGDPSTSSPSPPPSTASRSRRRSSSASLPP